MNIDDESLKVCLSRHSVGINKPVILHEFHNLIECLCAAAYMQIRRPIRIVELTDSTGLIQEKFVIPLTDSIERAEIEQKIAEEVDDSYFIKKAKEYYELTSIDPLEVVVWLHWEQGYGIRPKTQMERDIVNSEVMIDADYRRG